MKRTPPSWRFTVIFGAGVAILVLTWLGIAHWIVPHLIAAAYQGRSLDILNSIIRGQATVPLERYLMRWEHIANVAAASIVVIGVALSAVLHFRHRLRTAISELANWLTSIPLHPLDALRIAVWFGILTGLVEGIIVHARWAITDVPGREYSHHVIWMAPVTMALLFALGTLLLIVASWRHRRTTQGIVVLAFSFLGTYVVLHVLKLGLHAVAVHLLALGVAVQLTRLTTTGPGRFRRIVRSSTPWLVGCLATLGIAMGGWAQLAERRALSKLPPPPADAPNVLILLLDTVRASNLSLYGYQRLTTPSLDQLAYAGVVFDKAIAPSPWTLPSHASLFTGRQHHQVSADWMTPLDKTSLTLAEALAAYGYETSGFVANFYYAGRQTGLARGFARYEDRPVSVASFLGNAWLTRTWAITFRERLGNHQTLVAKSAAEVNERLLKWLSRRGSRPFFAFVNYFDAHDPYRPPTSFESPFSSKEGRYWTSWTGQYAQGEQQELVDAYDSVINYVDRQIGLLLTDLEVRGLLENTILIVTSDHGEQFGERHSRLYNHGNSLYYSLLHVPLVLVYPPQVPAGRRVSQPVSLRDIPATIMDLVSATSGSPFPGQSLRQHWSGPLPDASLSGPVLSELNRNTSWSQARPWAHEWEPTHRGPMKSLIRDTLHYIRNGDHSEELYDLAVDPWERMDLSDSPEGLRTLPSLRKCLADMLGESGISTEGVDNQDPAPGCSHGDHMPSPLGVNAPGGTTPAPSRSVGP